MKKFSIVIPAYNCGKYIINCLDSIKTQTFTNYEIIIINDNSTDTTGINVARFVEQNPDIDISVIYNETNQGVSSTRNIGIKKAEGEFILFADADDYYCDDKAFENFNSKLSPDTDILIFACRIEHLGNKDKKVFPTINIVPKQRDLEYKRALSPFKPLSTVWQLCCRREFLLENDIFFQEDIKKYEDIIFRQQAVAMADKISNTDKIAYTWNRRIMGASSLTIDKNNSYLGEIKKLVTATRRINELAKQYDFPPKTEKYFKRTVLKAPQGMFYVTAMALFYKLDFYPKNNEIERIDDVRE